MEGPVHTPDRDEWHRQLSGLLSDGLSGGERGEGGGYGTAAGHGAEGRGAPLRPLDKDLAWQEYMVNGQQGLDGLLAILNGEVRHAMHARGDGEERPTFTFLSVERIISHFALLPTTRLSPVY